MKFKTIFLTLILLTSCQSGNLAEDKIEIVDLLGRKNEIDRNKERRVVCIGAGALRLYSYIGENKDLVGAEDIDREESKNPFLNIARPYYDVNKEFYSTLKSCGKGGPKNQMSEAEKILSCNPNLVISEYEDKKASDELQKKIGCPVINVRYGNKSVFDENIIDSFRLLGKILQKEERAENLIDFIQNAKTELEEKALESDKRCYVGCLGNYGTQDIFSTSLSFPLFEVNKVKNALDISIPLENGKIEKEKLFALDPDVIFLDSAGLKNFKSTYEKEKDLFHSLSAFQNGNIYLEMPFNAYYTNLEIALMDAYYIGSVVNQENFKDFDIEKKSDEIATFFLGKNCYTETIKKAKMSFNGFQRISDIDSFFQNADFNF